jgi:hypothetical protein
MGFIRAKELDMQQGRGRGKGGKGRGRQAERTFQFKQKALDTLRDMTEWEKLVRLSDSCFRFACFLLHSKLQERYSAKQAAGSRQQAAR